MPQPGRRRLPFLHRNWTAGVTACQEWTPKRRRPAPTAALPDDRDDDPYVRPSKRRRVAPPLGGVDDIVKLPEYPGDRSNGLRIQVFNVFHQDTPRLRFANSLAGTPPADITRYNARFKVTILSEKCGLPLLMYCAAQIGSVQAFKAANGPYGLAKLVLEPFTVPLEQIAILHRDSDVFGLADMYKLRVEIESTASNDTWPPLDLLSLAGSRHGSDYRPKKAGDCVLYAESSDFFGRPRMRIPLWLRESPQHDPVRTKFVMDMDVRWTTGFLERPRRHLNLGMLPTIVALHPDEPLPVPTLDLHDLWPRRYSNRVPALATSRKVNGATGHANGYTNGITNGATVNGGAATNGHTNSQLQNQINDQLNSELHGQTNGQTNGHSLGAAAAAAAAADAAAAAAEGADSAAEDNNDEPDGALTPSRSLRARREQPDYNVRTIINKAHKISQRAPRKRLGKSFAGINGHHHGHSAASHDVKVSYSYHQEQLTVDGFVCCMCMASNPDVNQLRAHLLTHIHYSFQYENQPGTRGGGHTFKVSHAIDQTSSKYVPTVYQLGRPTRALDLEKLLGGDDSWITSRHGPQNDDKTVKLSQPPRPKTKPPPPKKTVLVPPTRQPLYDPLSKALLTPGTALRPTVVDDSWRIHKHREIVQDYTDLTPAEKEFIQEWDRFIILKRIASDAYIPRAMVQFVEEKGLWLVAELARTMEFGKLTAVMVAHDILTDDDLDSITEALDAAWARKQAAQPHVLAAIAARGSAGPKVFAPRWGANSCAVCGSRCSGADTVICCNKECPRRVYHATCLGDKAQVDVEQREEWYCNNCVHLADPAYLVRPLERNEATA